MNKTIELKIGDQVIQVPEWASESTMENLLRYARSEHKVTKAFGDEIKKFDGDFENFVKETSKRVEDLGKKQKKKEDDKYKSARSQFKKTAGDFNRMYSSSNPIDFIKKSVEPLKDLGKPVAKYGKDLTAKYLPGVFKTGGAFISKLGKFAGPLGVAANVATDAIAAYAGFLTAVYKDYSEASKGFIDLGFGLQEVDIDLNGFRSMVADASMNLKEVAGLMTEFGPTFASAGRSVAGGTMNVIKFLDQVDKTTDDVGNFGLNIMDLNKESMVFLEYKRMSGYDMLAVGENAKELSKEYRFLRMNVNTLSTLTGRSATEMMQEYLQNMATPERGFAKAIADDRGVGDSFTSLMLQLDNASKILSDKAPAFSGQLKQMADGVATAFIAAGKNESLSMQTALQQELGPEVYAQYQNLFGDGFNNIVSDLENGVAISADAINTMFAGLNKDQVEALNQAVGGSQNFAQIAKEISVGVEAYNNSIAGEKNLSEENLAVQKLETQENLKQLGAANALANNIEELRKSFGAGLAGLVMGMDKLAQYALNFADGLSSMIKSFNKILHTISFGYLGYDDAAAEFDRDVMSQVADESAKRALEEFKYDGDSFTGADELIMKAEPKETGGPITGQKPYIVGEAGPELFVPNKDGTIIPNNIMSQMLNVDKPIDMSTSAVKDTKFEDLPKFVLPSVNDLKVNAFKLNYDDFIEQFSDLATNTLAKTNREAIEKQMNFDQLKNAMFPEGETSQTLEDVNALFGNLNQQIQTDLSNASDVMQKAGLLITQSILKKIANKMGGVAPNTFNSTITPQKDNTIITPESATMGSTAPILDMSNTQTPLTATNAVTVPEVSTGNSGVDKVLDNVYNEMNETVDSLLTSRENTLELNKQLKSLFEHVSRTFVRDAGVKNQNS